MPKNRVCATATGLPKITRRAFVRATAATPLAAIPVAGFAQAPDDSPCEIEIYMQGFEAGRSHGLKQVAEHIAELNAARPVTIQARMEQLAKEACQLVRSIAPKEAGSITCLLGSNWHPHAPTKVTWNATADKFSQSPLPNGGHHWTSAEVKYLHPVTLDWF